MPRKHIPFAVRLAAYADKPEECWFLPNKKPGRNGYVIVTLPGRRGKHGHRAVYEEFFGPVSSALQMDHLCRNRACVNPYHVEPVTPLENQRRALPYRSHHVATACRKGHTYKAGSFRLQKRDGHWERVCLICQRERNVARNDAIAIERGVHRRGSPFCRRGHEYTPENTIPRGKAGRRCRKCKNEDDNRRNAL